MDISKVKLWLGERWGWVVTAASSVLFFFDMGFLLSFSIVFPSLQEEFNSTTTETAWVGSIPLGLPIFAPVVNILIELLGHRTVVVAGLSLSGCGLIATSFVRSLGPMFVTYSGAYGLGSGMLVFGSFSLLLQYFPLRNSTRAVVIPMACSNLGMFTLGPLTYFLKTRYGWRNMPRIMGTIVLATVPLSAITFTAPNSSKRLKEIRDETINCKSEDKNKNITVFTPSGNDGGTEHEEASDATDMYAPTETQSRQSEPRHDQANDEESETKCSIGKHQISSNEGRRERDFKRDPYVEISDNGVNDYKNEESMQVALKEKESEVLEDGSYSGKRSKVRSLPFRILVALAYPDLLLLAFSMLGYGFITSFSIIQLGSYMLSVGYTEQNGAQAVVVLGVSLMVGKVLLFLFADRAPFPKLGFFVIASVVGIVSLVVMLSVDNLAVLLTTTSVLGVAVVSTADSLPYSICNHIFGVERGTETVAVVGFFHGVGFISASLLGESVDRTGSYDLGLYACIGMYALCGLLCVMVPVWQRCFVTGRPIMDARFGWKRESTQRVTTDEAKPSTISKTDYKLVDHTSVV